jgi:hypothetical protein
MITLGVACRHSVCDAARERGGKAGAQPRRRQTARDQHEPCGTFRLLKGIVWLQGEIRPILLQGVPLR